MRQGRSGGPDGLTHLSFFSTESNSIIRSSGLGIASADREGMSAGVERTDSTECTASHAHTPRYAPSTVGSPSVAAELAVNSSSFKRPKRQTGSLGITCNT